MKSIKKTNGEYVIMVKGCADCPLCRQDHCQGFDEYICHPLKEYTCVNGVPENYVLPDCPIDGNKITIYRKKILKKGEEGND